jgi:hypothetical protein
MAADYELFDWECLRELLYLDMCGACGFYDEEEGTCTATKGQRDQINKEEREKERKECE